MPRPALKLVSALLLALFATAAGAEVPVSIGNQGAYRRASLSAAGPGSVNPDFDPVREEPGRFRLQWFLPFFCQAGAFTAPNLNSFEPDPSTCQTTDATLDTADRLAPIYVQPDATKRPNPGYLRWLWPVLPQLSFGSESGYYEAQLGVVVTSVGNGTLVRRFTNSPNTSFRRAGMYLAGHTPAVDAELLVGDFLSPGTMQAARVAVRPLVLLYSGQVARQPVEFDHSYLAAPLGRWITGFTIATDLVAPVRDEWAIAGEPSPFDPGVGPMDPFATAPLETRSVVGVGWENQLVLLQQSTTLAVAYVDVNALGALGNRSGYGVHGGFKLSGQAGRFRARLELEGNGAGPGYVPGYFDQMYMIERLRMIGLQTPKLAVEAPASYGYLARASVSYLPYVSLFLEGTDQLPVDATCGGDPDKGCGNSARVTGGMSGSWLMFGGTVSLSQSGVQHYLRDLTGPGLVFLTEGRVSLFFDYVQLLGRFFVVGRPEGGPPNLGGYLGLEINLSL